MYIRKLTSHIRNGLHRGTLEVVPPSAASWTDVDSGRLWRLTALLTRSSQGHSVQPAGATSGRPDVFAAQGVFAVTPKPSEVTPIAIACTGKSRPLSGGMYCFHPPGYALAHCRVAFFLIVLFPTLISFANYFFTYSVFSDFNFKDVLSHTSPSASPFTFTSRHSCHGSL